MVFIYALGFLNTKLVSLILSFNAIVMALLWVWTGTLNFLWPHAIIETPLLIGICSEAKLQRLRFVIPFIVLLACAALIETIHF